MFITNHLPLVHVPLGKSCIDVSQAIVCQWRVLDWVSMQVQWIPSRTLASLEHIALFSSLEANVLVKILSPSDADNVREGKKCQLSCLLPAQ